LEIANIDEIYSPTSGEGTVLATEFKISINAYLNELVTSPVRSLADLIDFNKKNSKLVSIIKLGSFDLCDVLHSYIRLTQIIEQCQEYKFFHNLLEYLHHSV